MTATAPSARTRPGGAEEEEVVVIDSSDCALLPGLIGGHVHIQTASELDAYGRPGATTVLDRGSHSDVSEPRSRNTKAGRGAQ
ncbi:hypothetical protein DL771_001392 [Monosporascus sp. 5C6A]|nr:hypothetical protein DL771_001392 [Monosporascus sp. 5C6A]